MVFEQIERLKQDYTDKSVIVDSDRPELRRFQGMRGIVKTVNMSGRALVEFDAHQNIGWYDIDLDYLKVVDTPTDSTEPEQSPAKAPKPAAKAQGSSVADILAAARGQQSDAKPAPAAKKRSPAKTQAPTKKAAQPPAKKAGGMSVSDILAAARGKDAATASESADKPEAKPIEKKPTKATTKSRNQCPCRISWPPHAGSSRRKLLPHRLRLPPPTDPLRNLPMISRAPRTKVRRSLANPHPHRRQWTTSLPPVESAMASAWSPLCFGIRCEQGSTARRAQHPKGCSGL